MTPLEINKRIAEIKGYKVWETDPVGLGCIVKEISNENNTLTIEYVPDWAENIADAWELFEEMPNEAFIRKEHDGRFSCFNGTTAFKAGNWCIADTAPLAICKAWLGWNGVEV